MESIRDGGAWRDLLWVLGLLAVGAPIAAGMDWADIPAHWHTTWVAFLPLAAFAFLRTRGSGDQG